jgi:hypothetical protein
VFLQPRWRRTFRNLLEQSKIDLGLGAGACVDLKMAFKSHSIGVPLSIPRVYSLTATWSTLPLWTLQLWRSQPVSMKKTVAQWTVYHFSTCAYNTLELNHDAGLYNYNRPIGLPQASFQQSHGWTGSKSTN